VEVTKLSLLLKVLEGATSDTLVFKLWGDRALPDLDRDIRCATSFVAPDIYGDQLSIPLTTDDRQPTNAFDWAEQFPHIDRGEALTPSWETPHTFIETRPKTG